MLCQALVGWFGTAGFDHNIVQERGGLKACGEIGSPPLLVAVKRVKRRSDEICGAILFLNKFFAPQKVVVRNLLRPPHKCLREALTFANRGQNVNDAMRKRKSFYEKKARLYTWCPFARVAAVSGALERAGRQKVSCCHLFSWASAPINVVTSAYGAPHCSSESARSKCRVSKSGTGFHPLSC